MGIWYVDVAMKAARVRVHAYEHESTRKRELEENAVKSPKSQLLKPTHDEIQRLYPDALPLPRQILSLRHDLPLVDVVYGLRPPVLLLHGVMGGRVGGRRNLN